MAVEDQVMEIYLAVKGYLMPVQVDEITEFEEKFIAYMHANHPEVGQHIKETKELAPADEEILKKAIAEFTKDYGASHELVKEEE